MLPRLPTTGAPSAELASGWPSRVLGGGLADELEGCPGMSA
jgi:hypothetical protein